MFIGRTDVEAKTPILWTPDAKSWLIWKDLDAGNDWGQEEKGTTEDEMVGWHHQLNGHGLVMDRAAWHVVVYGVTRSRTRLSDWTESRLKTCCTHLRQWSHLDLDNLLSFYISACYFILHFDVLEIAYFLKRHEPTSASFKLLLSFLTSLNLHKIEENFPILLLRLWLKEML